MKTFFAVLLASMLAVLSPNLTLAQNQTPTLLKKDFIVNSFDGPYNSDQLNPSVAMDSSGYFAIAWVDQRNGIRQPFVQVFDPQGERIGQNILLDSTALDWDGYPMIAAGNAGRFAVTWGVPKGKIYFQIVDIAGQKIGEKTLVESKTGGNLLPTIAMDPAGRFLICWERNSDVLAKLFDKNGDELSQTLQLNQNSNSAGIFYRGVKNVAADAMGHFAAAFTQYYNHKYRLFLQMIDSSGAKIGTPILAGNPNSNEDDYTPWISATRDGVFFMSWYGSIARIYRYGKGFVTKPFDIQKELHWNGYWQTLSCSSNGRDRFFIALGYSSLKIVMIDTSGTFLNDGVPLGHPPKAHFSNYVLVLTDLLNGKMVGVVDAHAKIDRDVDYVWINSDLSSDGAFHTTADDSSHGPQIDPEVVSNQDGQTLVVWADRRLGEYDLFGQVFDADGTPIGKNICITPEKDELYYGSLPFRVGVFKDGMFVVAYVRMRKNNYDVPVFKVFLRRISPDGTLNGPEKEVTTFYNSPPVLNLQVGAKEGLLLLRQNSSLIYSAFAYRFNEITYVRPNPIHILPIDTIKTLQKLVFCTDDSLNYLLLWQPYNEQECHVPLYGRFFDKNGRPISQSFIAEESNSYYLHENGIVACSMESPENYVILLYDYSGLLVKRYYRINNKNLQLKNAFHPSYNVFKSDEENKINILEFRNRKLFFTYITADYTVYSFYFDDNKNIIQRYQLYRFEPLSHIRYFDRDWTDYWADVTNGRIFFAYESNRHGGTDFDIWARVYALPELDFSPEPFYNLQNSFDELLLPGAPNPFPQSTKISYYLPTVEVIRLVVYDALGRKVTVLQNGAQSAGWHEVIFDASDLASGIYFCRLEGMHNETVKLVHLR